MGKIAITYYYFFLIVGGIHQNSNLSLGVYLRKGLQIAFSIIFTKHKTI